MVTAVGDARMRPRPDGPRHEPVPFSTAAALAARLAPIIDDAVVANEPVLAVVDDAVRDELHAALNGSAAGVEFADPARVHGVPPFTVAVRWARTCRRVDRSGARALVVGQQVPGPDEGHWARLCIGLDVAIAELPITVLCPYPDSEAARSRIRTTHPLLGGAPDPRRRPADALAAYPAPPPADLGPPTTELAVHPGGLTDLRHVVTAVAAQAGLASDRVSDVVLAVNELASNSVEHGPGTGRLRLWAGRGQLVAEISDSGRMDVAFPGMTLPPPAGARGRGLWLASELCDVLQIWSDDTGTTARVSIGG